MRIVSAFIAVVALGAAPLDSSLAQRGLTAPRVTVQSLEPLPSNGGPQRFRIALLVDNMNTEPLRLRDLEFKLRLADQGIIDGNTGALTIEALDQQTLMLEIGSDIISSLSRLLSFVQGPENTLPYEIYGRATPERRMKAPLTFGTRGQVPLVMTSAR